MEDRQQFGCGLGERGADGSTPEGVECVDEVDSLDDGRVSRQVALRDGGGHVAGVGYDLGASSHADAPLDRGEDFGVREQRRCGGGGQSVQGLSDGDGADGGVGLEQRHESGPAPYEGVSGAALEQQVDEVGESGQEVRRVGGHGFDQVQGPAADSLGRLLGQLAQHLVDGSDVDVEVDGAGAAARREVRGSGGRSVGGGVDGGEVVSVGGWGKESRELVGGSSVERGDSLVVEAGLEQSSSLARTVSLDEVLEFSDG